ncbi:MAG TPA: IPT/TIG domain-containing protein [Thermoanaerobaculia bacterium]|nr:IPT/TIG domain-containing protein [Thermoanaerobaculia bacterium]
MNTFKWRKSWIALMLILALFAGCKGESPTAPPPGGGNNGGGTTTPPVSSTFTLTTSNSNPLIDSIVTITATATQNGAAVPNGTAVEFVSTGGALDGGGTAVIKTTTNGVATVTLTASAASTIRVQATVNNVSRTVDVQFSEKPITPGPIDTTPTISSVSPSILRPAGGETIRITGTNFKAPVRVLFDVGLPLPVEASVVAVTATTIDVVTPAVTLGAGQQLVSDVIIITEAGSTTERRVAGADLVTFRSDQLTPRVSTATPNSGPVTGNTIVKIFGDGFQAPVQVLFGTAEARVIQVTYSEITVESPVARDTSSDGSGVVVGPVDIIVRNIASQTSVTLAAGFFYKNAVQITAVGPTEGIFTGGTRVQIDGSGFLAPVAVTIGGVAAQPISVSGTRVIALTSGVNLTACGDQTGPVTVTNIANGDQALGPVFTYRVPKPVVVDVTPNPATEGQLVQVLVANALPGVNRIKIGDRVVFPTSSVFNNDGSATFTVAVPTNLTFTTTACTSGNVTGTRNVPLLLDITYTNVQTGCTDTADDALTVNPTDASCQIPPPQNAVLTPITPPCVNMGNVAFTGTTTGTTNFTVLNSGGQPLIISNVAVSASANATVTVAPNSSTIAPQSSTTFTVTVDPTAAGGFSGTITINSNDPDTPGMSFCFSGNGV